MSTTTTWFVEATPERVAQPKYSPPTETRIILPSRYVARRYVLMEQCRHLLGGICRYGNNALTIQQQTQPSVYTTVLAICQPRTLRQCGIAARESADVLQYNIRYATMKGGKVSYCPRCDALTRDHFRAFHFVGGPPNTPPNTPDTPADRTPRGSSVLHPTRTEGGVSLLRDPEAPIHHCREKKSHPQGLGRSPRRPAAAWEGGSSRPATTSTASETTETLIVPPLPLGTTTLATRLLVGPIPVCHVPDVRNIPPAGCLKEAGGPKGRSGP